MPSVFQCKFGPVNKRRHSLLGKVPAETRSIHTVKAVAAFQICLMSQLWVHDCQVKHHVQLCPVTFAVFSTPSCQLPAFTCYEVLGGEHSGQLCQRVQADSGCTSYDSGENWEHLSVFCKGIREQLRASTRYK